jgi:hypothetical protein
MEFAKLLASKQRTAEVNLEFERIGSVNQLTSLVAEVFIDIKWRVADEEIEPGDRYSPKDHWNPQLYIENVKITSEEISYEIRQEQGVRYVVETRNVKGAFEQNTDFTNVSPSKCPFSNKLEMCNCLKEILR